MGLYKRGDIWWYWFFHDGRRIQNSTGKKNRRAAELEYARAMAAAQHVSERAPEAKTAPGNQGFEELRQRYMAEHSRPTKSEGSVIRDEYTFKQLDKTFGGGALKNITPSKIAEHKARRRAEGVKEGTLAKELQLLRNALNIAWREWEWIETTPFLKVKIDVPKNAIERYLDADEERRLLTECADWLRDVVLFAINTGMRRNEILTLKWPQVDLERRVITLHKTKNKQKRSVPMNMVVYELLKGRVARRKNSGHVFPSEVGTQIGTSNLERAFRRARKGASLDDVRFHDLRHTAGSRMAQKGVDIYTIGKILGHKTLSMTMRYAHHNVESLRHGLDAIVESGKDTATVGVS